MSDIQKLVKDYLDYLEVEKNRSPLTRKSYERCLRKFVLIVGAKKIGDVTESSIREFRVKLADMPGIKKGTQAYHIIVIRNFLKYLAKRGIAAVSADKIELPKVPQRQIRLI